MAPPLEIEQHTRPAMPGPMVKGDYPLIDSDPHFGRVVRYARTSDWLYAAGITVAMPFAMAVMARVSPIPGVPLRAQRGPMRLATAFGLSGGFLMAYSRSARRFFGLTENRREIDMDMREMTDRVKRGEKPYGESRLTDYMQGVAARQTRYTALNLNVLPWFNFVNHPYHGVDTAKYYQNAERELEAER